MYTDAGSGVKLYSLWTVLVTYYAVVYISAFKFSIELLSEFTLDLNYFSVFGPL